MNIKKEANLVTNLQRCLYELETNKFLTEAKKKELTSLAQQYARDLGPSKSSDVIVRAKEFVEKIRNN